MHTFDDEALDKMQLKYYSSDMHKASFVLPTAFQKVKFVYFMYVIIINYDVNV
jgi:hypothetical protein